MSNNGHVNENFPHDIHAAFCMYEIENGQSVMCRVFSARDALMVFNALSIKYPLVVTYDKDKRQVMKYENI